MEGAWYHGCPQKSQFKSNMHLSIRHYKVTDPKEVTRLVSEKFYPLIRAIPGFVAYYGIETDDGGWASINVFQTEEGAAESNKIGRNFAEEHKLNLAPPAIIAGTVVAQTAAA